MGMAALTSSAASLNVDASVNANLLLTGSVLPRQRSIIPVMRGADYDVIVIGSGFGGSVTALRLADKGYRVAVIEAGRPPTSA
jgi:heterodisulfide reductase subunit A-like polyferredoxin